MALRNLSIPQILDEIVAVEAGYVNNPNDLGGPTIWGITEAVARKNGYTGDMRVMGRDQAKAIYRSQYIEKPGFALVHAVSPVIAQELIDSGVNLGVSWPALWLQKALNAFNAQGKLYPDLRVDGDIGPVTVEALRAFMAKRGSEAEIVMLTALNSLQGARYIEVTEARAENESFTYGWFSKRVTI